MLDAFVESKKRKKMIIFMHYAFKFYVCVVLFFLVRFDAELSKRFAFIFF